VMVVGAGRGGAMRQAILKNWKEKVCSDAKRMKKMIEHRILPALCRRTAQRMHQLGRSALHS